MIQQILDIKNKDSKEYAKATTYILDTPEGLYIKKRPLVIVCPGGGYEDLSFREGEPIALKFNSMGFHAIVVSYSLAPATFPTALLEVAKTVLIAHEKANEWKIDTSKIFVAGFSAGGHLAASYGVFWNRDFVTDAMSSEVMNVMSSSCMDGDNKLQDQTNLLSHLKIAGMILAYPVITSGEFAHKNSFECLLGIKKDSLNLDNSNVDEETRQRLNDVSLEKQVTKDTVPAFIWTTFEDGLVPAENSLLMAMALKEKNIPVEFHMYPRGGHGLALGNVLTNTSDGYTQMDEVSNWIEMAGRFIENTSLT